MKISQSIKKGVSCLILSGIFLIFISAEGVGADKKTTLNDDTLLGAMQEELNRAQKELRLPEQPGPYFISFWIQERASSTVSGKYGAISHAHPELHPSRTAYVQVRVGSNEFDNSNLPLTTRFNPEDLENLFAEGDWQIYEVPTEGDRASLRAALWLLSDAAYKKAIGDYQKKKALLVTSGERKKINDFSRESPNIFIGTIKEPFFDYEAWKDIIRKVTSHLAAKPEILEPRMSFRAERIINYYANTEGTVIRTSEVFYSADIEAYMRTPDGMKVSNFRHFFVRDPKELPDAEKLLSETENLYKELAKLRDAEEFKPYTGPAILSPDVAGVFFHEALGHRLEGERQRMPESGQTFKGKVGEKILPEFLTIIDDPTIDRYDGKTLAGFYSYDNEGTAAQKVVLIERGVLKNYLMSRTPIEGYNKSNGHGRSQGPTTWNVFAQTGARMANFIVESEKKLEWQKLKSMLIDEAKRQGKPYGIIIRHISAGETNTQVPGGFFGGSFQAFRATPVLVYSVDVETGVERLVRGVELVGTPLVSLEKIIATGEDYDVFQGICGAESGQVPISVVSPSILTAQVELQRIGGKPKSPPILPSPFIQ